MGSPSACQGLALQGLKPLLLALFFMSRAEPGHLDEIGISSAAEAAGLGCGYGTAESRALTEEFRREVKSRVLQGLKPLLLALFYVAPEGATHKAVVEVRPSVARNLGVVATHDMRSDETHDEKCVVVRRGYRDKC
jgi:hypothetical protein